MPALRLLVFKQYKYRFYMEHIFELDNILSKYRGEFDNYWYDYLILDAIDILNKFNDAEWKHLFDILQSQKNELWYLALISILSDTKNLSNALELCISIFRGNSYAVQIATIDTINAIISGRDISIRIINEIKCMVVNFTPKSTIDDIVYNALLSNLAGRLG